MKNLWIILFCIISVSLLAQDANKIFQDANDAYVNKSYDKAIELYESIVQQELKSPELFLNLGNAYFQKSKFAQAILSYERGLKRSPNDKDLLANLEITNNQLDSEILEVPPFVLVRWWRGFCNVFSTNVWAIIQVLLMGVMAFFVGKYFLKQDVNLKRKSFYTALSILPFFILSFLAANSKANFANNESAVVMTETAIKDGPDDRSGEINKLYPGNTVEIIDQIEEWYKVKLVNQSEGWISANSIEKI